jgi:hypothetical protein
LTKNSSGINWFSKEGVKMSRFSPLAGQHTSPPLFPADCEAAFRLAKSFRVLILLCLILLTLPAAAQSRGDIFIGGLGETILYSAESLSYGGGLTAGFSTGYGPALGIRAACFADTGGAAVLEICAFLRFYLPSLQSRDGFFVQLNAGPSLYSGGGLPGLPSRAGMFSGGVQAGWRFIFNDHFYLEPAVRAGYPYIAGAGLAAGYLF